MEEKETDMLILCRLNVPKSVINESIARKLIFAVEQNGKRIVLYLTANIHVVVPRQTPVHFH